MLTFHRGFFIIISISISILTVFLFLIFWYEMCRWECALLMRMWSLMGDCFSTSFLCSGFYLPQGINFTCADFHKISIWLSELGSVKTEPSAPAEKDNSENSKKPIIFFMHLTDDFFICISKSLEFIAKSCKVSIPVIEMMMANFWNNLSF